MGRPSLRDGRRFQGRAEAGGALAAEVARVVGAPCVVAATPRGGVAVALPVAERLQAPLTVAYARKLTAPVAPELAFGAVDEDGESIVDAATVAMLSLSPSDVEEATARVRAEIQRRMALYKAPPLAHYLPGAGVVLVDDGLATGLTMRAALAYARRHGASFVTVAVPCASATAAQQFQREADRLVSLAVDEAFRAVGEYYLDFSPVTDQQVIAMLAGAEARPGQGSPPGSGLRLSFTNSRGLRLAGRLLLPAGRGPHPVIVFAHGWGSSKDSPRNRVVAEALRGQGFAALLFDFTGHGESDEEESGLPDELDDLGAALTLLEALDEVDAGRMGVLGTSSGAAVALLRAAVDPRIRALALRSGSPSGAEPAASHVSVPTLLVVSERDDPIRAANEDLVKRLGGPSRLEVIAAGDHLFEDPATLQEATDTIVAWFSAHLRRS